jgi:uncharacterized protein YbjT (DUF2867 family)
MILVTGGTGFVGGHVVSALREAGKPVRCLVRDPRRGQALEALGCELVEGDMTRAETLLSAVEGVECVVHLVAIRQGKPSEFEAIMSEGTRSLLDAAQRAGVRRFVHMSALGTTEETKDVVPYYGAKWDMEQAVQGSGLPYVVFRPSFIFAPDGGILPTFRKIAKLMPVTPISGPGTQRLQPIWADDLAVCFARAVDDESVTNRTLELGGPDVVDWNELWDRLKRALGVRRPSINVPMSLMRANALVTERLPGNIPLTRDLLKMMEVGDNVVTGEDGARSLGVTPLPLDEQLRRSV